MAGLYVHSGINLSSNKLQLVEIFGAPEEVRLENLNEVEFKEPLNFKLDKESKILIELQAAFDQIRLQKPIRSVTISFSIPLELFYITQLPYDNTLLHRDILEEFKWEFSVLYPFIPPDEISLQYLEVERNMVFTKNTAIVYGIERKYLQILQKFCEQNNLKLGYIDNAHLSSERALALSDSFIKQGLRLSAFITDESLSNILSLDGKTIAQKVYTIQSKNDIRQLIEQDITPSKTRNIMKGLVQAGYIAGDDLDESFIQNLSNKIGISFIAFNPFDKLTPHKKIKESTLYSKKYNSFSAAAGIAYRIG
jgi:Tfp pilus assembly PilM family ATPase